MQLVKRTLPAAMFAGLMGLSAPSFAAQHISNRELLKLVQQQAAQIKDLKQRLSALEAHERGAANAPVVGAPVAGASTATSTSAAVQAAIADSRAGSDALVKAQTAAAGTKGSGSVRWGNRGEAGPTFQSDDGFFTFKPKGRLLMDFTGTRGSQYPERNINGSQLTSARLGAEGTIGPLGYHLEVDFADDSVGLRQAYLTYSTRLLGHHTKFYLGNFLKDLGTEGSSQSARVPFMLRNAAATVGEPVNSYFGLGLQMRTFGDNWHYSLSVSGDSPTRSSNGDTSDSVAYMTRAHWNPIKTGAGFMHVGAWYYYEKLSPGITKINNHPSIALDYNDNLDVSASSISDPTQDHASGYELGGVYRNFWVMSEYAKRSIDSSSDDPVHRHGSSLAGGWMITGEKPGFSSHSGTWQWVRVNRPVTSGGWGAFELAGRVDHYDYHGGAPRGGDGQSYTLGLNWYLNDWSRLMFNYIRWHTDNQVGSEKGSDWGNSFGLRTEVVF